MTSSGSKRNERAARGPVPRSPAAPAAIIVLAAAFLLAPLAGAASPTATHIYPGPVTTGEPIQINVTIDPHNTMPISVVARWWTSLSETRYQAEMVNSSADPMDWKGQIPAQSKPCQVYYTIEIDYLYYNENIGAMSMDTVRLPGTSGNYLVTVKGELFSGTSAWGIAIGVGLMALAVGVVIYAQRLGPKWDRRFEESIKASKEKVSPDDAKRGENAGTDARDGAGGPESGDGESGKADRRARKVPLDKDGKGEGTA